MAIKSFKDPATADVFMFGRTKRSIGWKNIESIVKRKIDMLHYASKIHDLRAPPGNRLEALKGKLAGCYSIRINDQWRLVFRWVESGPEEVYVCDYH